MTMTYTAHLTCGGCKAVLTFTDARPAWKTYDYRVEQAEECERSARFVQEHAGQEVPDAGGMLPTDPVTLAWHDAGRPRFARHPGHWPARVELYIPPPYEYVDCPVCDDKITKPAPDPGRMR
jgi:hypothetical protein